MPFQFALTIKTEKPFDAGMIDWFQRKNARSKTHRTSRLHLPEETGKHSPDCEFTERRRRQDTTAQDCRRLRGTQQP